MTRLAQGRQAGIEHIGPRALGRAAGGRFQAALAGCGRAGEIDRGLAAFIHHRPRQPAAAGTGAHGDFLRHQLPRRRRGSLRGAPAADEGDDLIASPRGVYGPGKLPRVFGPGGGNQPALETGGLFRIIRRTLGHRLPAPGAPGTRPMRLGRVPRNRRGRCRNRLVRPERALQLGQGHHRRQARVRPRHRRGGFAGRSAQRDARQSQHRQGDHRQQDQQCQRNNQGKAGDAATAPGTGNGQIHGLSGSAPMGCAENLSPGRPLRPARDVPTYPLA